MRERTNSELGEALLRAGVGLAVLEGLGFESAPASGLGSKILTLQPDGGTSMRDSLIQGIQMMLQLHQILAQCGIAGHWNFVHVVITDGDDTSSHSSLQEAAAIMELIGRTIPARMLKTWFIGVDIENSYKAIQEIGTLVSRGGGNAQFAKISANNMDQIFTQLRINLGLIQHTQVRGVQVGDQALIGVRQQDYAVVTVEEQHYVVLFNLDASGSMSGSRWNSVCRCVNEFIKNLGPEDLVAGLAFNTQVIHLTLPEPKKKNEYCLAIICLLLMVAVCFGFPPLIFCCSEPIRKQKCLYGLCISAALGGFLFYLSIFGAFK